MPTPPLGAEEKAAFDRLTTEEVAEIDQAILSCATFHWHKVAMIVIRAQEKLAPKYLQFSCIVYAERIQLLAEQGKLESQGNLSFMRFSEVRLRLNIDADNQFT